MPEFINLSAYKFTPLAGLPPLREHLSRVCGASGLKGTILLSPEGINLFVAGRRAAVDGLVEELRAVRGLENLELKESRSAEQPYGRMFVKIKNEVIAFGVDGIDPATRPAPKLKPRVLKQWLDEGRAITLLDTRNDYEVKLGTFRGAIPAGIRHFRDFPAAAHRLPERLKDQPIVMFCTGGIRCEKAGPYLERVGFKDVHQLDGGILRYFEECGGAHFDGECFVFDERVGLNAALETSGASFCTRCQTPLTAIERQHPSYVRNTSCPHCIDRNLVANVASTD